MSTTYPGKPGNESRASAVSIASSTNATPIEVTTTGAHGLLDGDRVQIVNHETNTAANGVWYALAITTTKVRLYSSWAAGTVAGPSTGNGVGGATGTVRCLGLMPRVTHVDDGDLRSASSINVGLEDAKDGQAWLAERTGAYRLVHQFSVYVANDPTTTSLSGSSTAGAWAAPSPLNSNLNAAFAQYVDALEYDLLDVTLTGTVVIGAAAKLALRLAVEARDYGVAFTGTATSPIIGSAQSIDGAAGRSPICLRGVAQLSAAKWTIPLLQDHGIGAGVGYSFEGDVLMHVKLWRPN